jgi:hypothetical protein
MNFPALLLVTFSTSTALGTVFKEEKSCTWRHFMKTSLGNYSSYGFKFPMLSTKEQVKLAGIIDPAAKLHL